MPGRALGTIPVPRMALQKINLTAGGYLGYGLPELNRLNASTRRASRVRDRTRTLTNQAMHRLVRAVFDLEAAGRPLQQCMQSWGACVVLARHLESTVRSRVFERAGSVAEVQPTEGAAGGGGGTFLDNMWLLMSKLSSFLRYAVNPFPNIVSDSFSHTSQGFSRVFGPWVVPEYNAMSIWLPVSKEEF